MCNEKKHGKKIGGNMKGLNFFYRCSSVFTEPLQKEGKR